MSRPAVPLVLSDDDRAQLARLVQAGPPWLAERARIVLACAEPGSGMARVAAELGATGYGAEMAEAVRRGGPGRAGRS